MTVHIQLAQFLIFIPPLFFLGQNTENMSFVLFFGVSLLVFIVHDCMIAIYRHEFIHTGESDGCDAESFHKSKAKRVRTTFTEEQLQVLQANFQIDSNPDGQDLERIASVTGLSKRVTQVWFQNSRARQKKHIHSGALMNQNMNASAHIQHIVTTVMLGVGRIQGGGVGGGQTVSHFGQLFYSLQTS